MENKKEIKVLVHENFYKKIEKFAQERLMSVEGFTVFAFAEYMRRHNESSNKLESKLQASLDELG